MQAHGTGPDIDFCKFHRPVQLLAKFLEVILGLCSEGKKVILLKQRLDGIDIFGVLDRAFKDRRTIHTMLKGVLIVLDPFPRPSRLS